MGLVARSTNKVIGGFGTFTFYMHTTVGREERLKVLLIISGQ